MAPVHLNTHLPHCSATPLSCKPSCCSNQSANRSCKSLVVTEQSTAGKASLAYTSASDGLSCVDQNGEGAISRRYGARRQSPLSRSTMSTIVRARRFAVWTHSEAAASTKRAHGSTALFTGPGTGLTDANQKFRNQSDQEPV